MALPTNVKTGLVKGRFLLGNGNPATGTVTFRASVTYLPSPIGEKAILINRAVICRLDSLGYLCAPNPTDPTIPGTRDVSLIATTGNPDIPTTNWTWEANYRINEMRDAIPAHSFSLPALATVDLASVVKIPSSPGVGENQALALVAAAEQAAADAEAAAAAAAASAAGAVNVEGVRDTMGTTLVAGTKMTVTVNDAADTITLGTTALDAEGVRDMLIAGLVAGTNITVTHNDTLDTITLATTATVNQTDTFLRARANHTGTQLASTISDFTESTQDVMSSTLVAGTGIAFVYDDVAGTITVTGSAGGAGTDPEGVRDTMAAAFRTSGLISITHDDIGDTITVGTTATANSSDTFLLNRTNHTGTQSADTIVDGTTNKVFTATEETKLAGIATNATANQTDTFLRARANHTGTQTADTITDGVTNKVFTATEETKLAGIADSATANSTDTFLLARANHTGVLAASVITSGTLGYARLPNLLIPVVAVSGAFPTTIPSGTKATDVIMLIGPASTPAPTWKRDNDVWIQH